MVTMKEQMIFIAPTPEEQPQTSTATTTLVEPNVYSDEEWGKIAEEVRVSERAVEQAREARRLVDLEYDQARKVHTDLLKIRDEMIKNDSRSAASLGRLLGVTRNRCAQIKTRSDA